MSDRELPVTDWENPARDVSQARAVIRVRLDISYDGTDFSGWAVQPGRRTVQAELQHALATLLRQPSVQLTVAGRTDAGVHASGQVAHLEVAAAGWDAAQALRGLAGLLPADVRVLRAIEVPADFDARFGALWRRYEYRISDRPTGVEPLRRRFVLDRRRSLDAAAMADAASRLLGLNDFMAFCRWRELATTVRTVHTFDVRREDAELVCTIQADAFCHSMVRSLVGALIAVGEGRQRPEWPASLLTRTTRADDVTVAPPHGLTLVRVGYPPDSELAARARLTRVRRATR